MPDEDGPSGAMLLVLRPEGGSRWRAHLADWSRHQEHGARRSVFVRHRSSKVDAERTMSRARAGRPRTLRFRRHVPGGGRPVDAIRTEVFHTGHARPGRWLLDMVGAAPVRHA